jgi:hypothetical protein
MCEKVIARIPSMTSEERQQLRRNCLRAVERSPDPLIVKEARKVIAELDLVERRELDFVGRLPTPRRIEYAFRRLPANDRERHAIRLLNDQEPATPQRIVAVLGESRPVDWPRPFAAMCRDRWHLLPDAAPANDGGSEAQAYAAALIDYDAPSQTIRLKPEALAAFATLGYLRISASS